jgi:O-antigen ligase
MMALFLIQASPLYSSYGIFARSYTLADIVGALVLLGWIIRVAQREQSGSLRILRGWRAQAVLAVVAYFAWDAVTSAWSPAPVGLIIDGLRHDAEHAVFFALSILLLTQERQVRRAAGTYAVVGTVLALYTILTFRSNQGFAQVATWTISAESYRGGLPSTFNVNELSTVLALVPGFIFLAAGNLSRRMQLALTAASVPVIGLALIILTSREVFLAVLLSFMGVLVLARGYRSKVALVPFALLGIATFGALANSGNLPRYFQTRIAATQYDNFGQRLPLWRYGLESFAQHPLSGLGAEGLEATLPASGVAGPLQTSVHNDLIRTLANNGLPGFLLLVAMLVILGRAAIQGGQRNPASVGIAVILLVSINSGTFLQTHWMWVALSIVCCLGIARGAQSGASSADPKSLHSHESLRRVSTSSLSPTRAASPGA